MWLLEIMMIKNVSFYFRNCWVKITITCVFKTTYWGDYNYFDVGVLFRTCNNLFISQKRKTFLNGIQNIFRFTFYQLYVLIMRFIFCFYLLCEVRNKLLQLIGNSRLIAWHKVKSWKEKPKPKIVILCLVLPINFKIQ